MFTLTVRDHAMLAHSLPDPFFGPAQGLHGVTYLVEASFERPDLDEHGVVLDIGAATEALGEVLGRIRYQNLDELAEFEGMLTTTEVMARWVAQQLADQIDTTGLSALTVTLHEHPDARASYRMSMR